MDVELDEIVDRAVRDSAVHDLRSAIRQCAAKSRKKVSIRLDRDQSTVAIDDR